MAEFVGEDRADERRDDDQRVRERFGSVAPRHHGDRDGDGTHHQTGRRPDLAEYALHGRRRIGVGHKSNRTAWSSTHRPTGTSASTAAASTDWMPPSFSVMPSPRRQATNASTSRPRDSP